MLLMRESLPCHLQPPCPLEAPRAQRRSPDLGILHGSVKTTQRQLAGPGQKKERLCFAIRGSSTFLPSLSRSLQGQEEAAVQLPPTFQRAHAVQWRLGTSLRVHGRELSCTTLYE